MHLEINLGTWVLYFYFLSCLFSPQKISEQQLEYQPWEAFLGSMREFLLSQDCISVLPCICFFFISSISSVCILESKCIGNRNIQLILPAYRAATLCSFLRGFRKIVAKYNLFWSRLENGVVFTITITFSKRNRYYSGFIITVAQTVTTWTLPSSSEVTAAFESCIRLWLWVFCTSCYGRDWFRRTNMIFVKFLCLKPIFINVMLCRCVYIIT